MRKIVKTIPVVLLIILITLASFCFKSPKEEATSIAMQDPEFKQAYEQKDAEIVFSEKNGTWIIKVNRTISNETVENPVVFIDPKTKKITKVYKISEMEAREIAIRKWWEGKAMIPENKAIGIVVDKEDYWLVTIQIIDMFTGAIVSPNAGKYKVDKITGNATEFTNV